MYESPIDIIYNDIQHKVEEEFEKNVLSAVQSYGIDVNKEELLKALQYDRQQYDKGYADAKAEQQWTPCSERLPDDNGRYLVTRGLNACGSLWNRVYIVNYSDLMGINSKKIWWSGNIGKSDFEKHEDILAWMPLPEPARLGGTDG